MIDDFEAKCFVAPYYGKKERPVALGNVFKQPKTKKKPALKIYCPHIKSTPGLTIALTDPDAPSRDDPKWSEMCHWIAIIPTSSHDGFEINLGGKTDVKELVECKYSTSGEYSTSSGDLRSQTSRLAHLRRPDFIDIFSSF